MQRNTIIPPCQRFTRRAVPRTPLNRFSIRLVDDSTRSKFGGTSRRITVMRFIQPLAQRRGGAGVVVFEAAREIFQKFAGLFGVAYHRKT